jgi:NAD(P)-dependent dehydrogenase (short-subunit alcohol dehydrogenase family)
MAVNRSLVVLITGCSSGIGRALALEFAGRGHRVFATARKPESIADLAGGNIETLRLDVTDEASIMDAVAEAASRAGGLDVIVNNAGFGLMGPVADLSTADLRRQLETNVVGPHILARTAVPHMVKRGGGIIVNVGSVSGVLTTPFSGAYCASKAAIHSLSDAMRIELAPLGIKVVTLQPGGVVSKFGDNAASQLAGTDQRSFYAEMADVIQARAQAGQEGAIDAGEFARHAVDAVLSPEPPAVFRMGANSVKLPLIKWLLPTKASDRFLSKRFSLDRLKKR